MFPLLWPKEAKARIYTDQWIPNRFDQYILSLQYITLGPRKIGLKACAFLVVREGRESENQFFFSRINGFPTISVMSSSVRTQGKIKKLQMMIQFKAVYQSGSLSSLNGFSRVCGDVGRSTVDGNQDYHGLIDSQPFWSFHPRFACKCKGRSRPLRKTIHSREVYYTRLSDSLIGFLRLCGGVERPKLAKFRVLKDK
jgi:hypothetical protein